MLPASNAEKCAADPLRKGVYFAGRAERAAEAQIVAYTINPVEARSASLEKPESLELKLERPADVAQLEDFIKMDAQAVREYHGQMGFAMMVEDLLFVQDYFKTRKSARRTFPS